MMRFAPDVHHRPVVRRLSARHACALMIAAAVSMPVAAAPGQESMPFKPVFEAPPASASPFRPVLEPADQPEASAPLKSTPIGPPTSPRDLFRALRVDDSHFRSFRDGAAIGPEDTEALLRVLVRVPDFPLAKIEGWARDKLPLAQLRQESQEHRAEIYKLKGRVVRVTHERPLPEFAARYDLAHYFRCEVIVPDQGFPAVVYAREIPSQWPLDFPLDEPVSVHAFFLKRGPDDRQHVPLVFAAQRIAWHPQTVLGMLGMDYGLFDTVRNRKPIQDRESECFYQMLAAVRRAGARELLRRAREHSIVPLLKEPEAQHGKLVSVQGVARRAVLIRISDPQLVSRLGFDHYYELDVFVDLGGVITVDDQRFNTYPATFCVAELPAGMPTGDKINEVVEVAGFFFKTWAYRSELISGDPNRRQLSPLLIGRAPVWVVSEEAGQRSYFGPIVGGLFATTVVIISLLLWQLSRSDRKFRDARRARNHNLPAGKSLNELGLDASRRRE